MGKAESARSGTDCWPGAPPYFLASLSSAVLEWLLPCRASGIPEASSFLVRSPVGLVSFASADVPVGVVGVCTVSLGGRLLAAPSDVPGVVVELEGTEEDVDEGAEVEGVAGVEDDAGATGAAAGASARLQPAKATPISNEAARAGRRLLWVGRVFMGSL